MISKICRVQLLILSMLLVANIAAAKTTVSNFQLKGNTVTAIFAAADPLDPCLESIVSVVAADLVEKLMPGGKSVVLRTALVVVERDVCTDTILFSGEGGAATHTLVVASDLSSASLAAQGTLQDSVTMQAFPFQVSLSFTGIGKPQSTNTHEKFRDPEAGIKITTKSKSTIVDAVATGTVSGIGRNHTPAPSELATIQKNNDGTHVVERSP
jgi:hypothetical protein